jgi:hypothetical protein
MTVKSEVAAIAPTPNAKAVVSTRGADIGGVMQLLQQHAVDLQILVKTVIALHPTGDANLTALNNILAELL